MAQKTGKTTDSREVNQRKTKDMVRTALFGAIVILMAFTPFLGYIPLGFTRATIIHVPVILGSLMLGPKKGAVLGSVFGLTSLINNTINPTVTSFVFTPLYTLGEFQGGVGSLVICFVPRILVGILPYYIYKGCKKLSGTKRVSALGLILSGVAGSLTNTLLVMNLIFVFFRDTYAQANEVASGAVYGFILSIIGMNGIPEAIVAGVLTFGIGRVMLRGKH